MMILDESACTFARSCLLMSLISHRIVVLRALPLQKDLLAM